MTIMMIIIILIIIRCFRPYMATRLPESTQAVSGVGNSRLISTWIYIFKRNLPTKNLFSALFIIFITTLCY
jgi:hypothetical protein